MKLDESNGKPLAVLMLAIAMAAADADAAAAAAASSVSGLSFLPPSPIHVYQRAASCSLTPPLTHAHLHTRPARLRVLCVCARTVYECRRYILTICFCLRLDGVN